MAAEVGTRESKRDLVTHDLLGGSSAPIGSSNDLDLSLKVASGWQARFELLNHGTVPLRRPGSQGLRLLPEQGVSGLELKLMGPGAPSSRVFSSGYASVCTLDKVKSALERARRVSPSNPTPAPANRRRASGVSRSSNSPSPSSSSSASSITSSSSMKRRGRGEEEEEEGADGCESSSGGLTAAGCPRCLMYVLISNANPRCPRCDSQVAVPVPVPVLQKRPRIDLNFSLGRH